MFMIYGANGYTGELIAREASKRGQKPVLAGRNSTAVTALAAELGLESRIFSLDQAAEQVAAQLTDVDVVIHCAGPFSATSQVMIDACVLAGTHYTDISGEMDVFEHAHSTDINDQAIKANIVVCPGVGFDVIPTDCVAAKLKSEMPDATDLVLGFSSRSSLSPGTAKTSVESLGDGTRIRKNGVIQVTGLKTRKVNFGEGDVQAAAIGWGDVSTAFHTTGIKNIEVYIPAPDPVLKKLKTADKMRWLFKIKWVQNVLKKQIEKKVKGPNQDKRAASQTLVWGEVHNANGDTKTCRITTANGYDVTVYGALAVADYLSENPQQQKGSYTPSLLMGHSLVEGLPGSGSLTISDS